VACDDFDTRKDPKSWSSPSLMIVGLHLNVLATCKLQLIGVQCSRIISYDFPFLSPKKLLSPVDARSATG
jgi:hypothetical protein